MDMEKRMQLAHISAHEIPLLGLDIGGITVKLTFFDIKRDTSLNDQFNSGFENVVNVNLAEEQIENRERIKVLLNQYLKKTTSYTVREFEIKKLKGYLHCYLFRREKLNELMQKLNSSNLKRPFIVLTGTALVNYIVKLEEQFSARVIIIATEYESLLRGIGLLHNQTLTEMFYEMELKNSEIDLIKPIKSIQTDRFYPFLLVIIGTSTIYMRINSSSEFTVLNTSAISGQTFIGMCNALNKLTQSDRHKRDELKSFEQCVKMATEGRNEIHDVTIKNMCENNDYRVEQFLFLHNIGRKNHEECIKEFSDMPVSVFGETRPHKDERKEKIAALISSACNIGTTNIASSVAKATNQIEMNDYVASILNLICYQIAEMMNTYCKLLNLNLIVCAGSFLTNNLTAKRLITKYLNLLAHNRIVLETKKKKLYFIDNEAYLGAIGCMAIDQKIIVNNSLDQEFI